MIDIFIAMATSASHLALVTIAYGMIRRMRLPRAASALLQAAAFSLGTLAVMVSPAPLAAGVMIDARATVIGLAAAFAGPIPAIAAAITGALYRLHIGGAGAAMGCLSILYVLASGLWWRFRPRPHAETRWSDLVLLGSVLVPHAAVVFFIPTDKAPGVILAVVAVMAASCFVSTLAFGRLILREDQLLERERVLRDFAYADPLTGLPNRREFEAKIEEAFGRGTPPASGCLLLMDFDHFKDVNDRFGHAAGDDALKQLARLLQTTLRAGDFVARHGGEEFVAFLPETSALDARYIAERIRQRVAWEAMKVGEETLLVTVSIGIASANGKMSLAELFASADKALYRAKTAGRNRVEAAAEERGRNLPLPATDEAEPSSAAPAAAA
ncbi:GGDEF domain-containing protein [Consotaella salsifontis]|uniref:diguanylate cyclase n=1 Tax=Consotaella salsifontis TaxID=1365950 RepID=A0A1T4T4W8_9HYPH|nr:diguanylate cyclase [Consotaella salsifontis]SKA35570.1 diguanylate cyclase [Consotaella salsifontis]